MSNTSNLKASIKSSTSNKDDSFISNENKKRSISIPDIQNNNVLKQKNLQLNIEKTDDQEILVSPKFNFKEEESEFEFNKKNEHFQFLDNNIKKETFFPENNNFSKKEKMKKLIEILNIKDKSMSSGEIQTITKLIDEKNSFLQEICDIYDFDNDLDELLDTLRRFIYKFKVNLIFFI